MILFEELFKLGAYFFKKKYLFISKLLFQICLFDKKIKQVALLNLTYFYEFSANNRMKAIKMLKKELSKNKNEDLEFQLAFFYSLENKNVESKKIYEKILNRKILKNQIPEHDLISNLINIYNKLEEYNKAIELFIDHKNQTNKLSININNSGLFYNLGNTYLDIKKYDEAVNYYRFSLKYNNDDKKSNILYNLAYSYYSLKDYDNAIIYFNKSLINIKNNNFEQGKAIAGIGYCYREKKLYNDAVKYFKQAVELGYTKAQEDIDYIIDMKKDGS